MSFAESAYDLLRKVMCDFSRSDCNIFENPDHMWSKWKDNSYNVIGFIGSLDHANRVKFFDYIERKFR